MTSNRSEREVIRLRVPGDLGRLWGGATFFAIGDQPFDATVVRRRLRDTIVEGIVATPYLVVRSQADAIREPRRHLVVNVILNGVAEVGRAGRELVLNGQELFVFNPDEPFEYRFPRPSMTFRTVVPDALTAERPDLMDPPFTVLETSLATRTFVLFARELLQSDQRSSAGSALEMTHLERALLHLQRAILEQLAGLVAPETPVDALRGAVLEHIEDHLTEPDLGPPSIASEFGISVRALHTLFVPLPDTVAERIRRRRVEEAADMLITTDLPISRIATALGFSSADALGRSFRALVGMTMTEYRAGATTSRLVRS